MKVIIAGSGAAGMSAARTLREIDKTCEIKMISKDAGYYSRCMLHLVAAGNKTEKQVILAPHGWEEKLGVEFIPSQEITELDAAAKTIRLDDGSSHNFDRLLIATGSRATMPPVTGINGPGVFGLRNIEDAVAIRETMANSSDYVIIGAGLVGVELALELSHAGKRVALVEMAPYPLPMQLESETGSMCSKILEDSGVSVFCGQLAGEIIRHENGLPKEVLLKSGIRLSADVVVAAAGVKANMDFAVDAGLKFSRGLLIDEKCETSAQGIFAAGDVAEGRDTLMDQVIPSAIWPTAVRQGKVAAMNILGISGAALERNTGFKASVVLNRTQVISLGPVYKPDSIWEKRIVRSTGSNGQLSIKIFYLHEGLLKAALLWGDITNSGLYFEAIVNKRPIMADLPYLDQLDAAKRGVEQLQVL